MDRYRDLRRALGAPLGVAIYHGWHFTGIAMAIIVVPLLPLMFITVRAVAPTSTKRTPFYKVMGAVWRPGLGLALASVGFGMITAFIALLFAAGTGQRVAGVHRIWRGVYRGTPVLCPSAG